MLLKILTEASAITEKASYMDLALNWIKTNWQLSISIGVSLLLFIILVSVLLSKKSDSKNIHYAKMKSMKGVKKE